ncbi:MAG: Lrp/AsnC family transcriptional regulator [Gemmatimonadales bacterium]|nr:Lrp/AsnC family transcriptional regulator [Gemmatimonadales bacterium]
MTPKIHEVPLDAVDRKLLALLQKDGRTAVSRIAEAVGLSAPPVHDRLARLEKAGVIRGYVALLEPARLGLGMTVYVSVTLALHREGSVKKFRDAVHAVPAILECHHTTGTADFLLKVVVKDTAEYEQLVLHRLTRLPGVERLNSSVVLSTFKAETALPLE